MANKFLFTPAKSVTNEAGGNAVKLSPKEALATYAATGCLNNVFYATAKTQLDSVLALCNNCPQEYVAKVAVYARTKAFMKDMPALLCAYLSNKNSELFSKIFPTVINNGKMLRNFVQILRSGISGSKSCNSTVKRVIADWFNSRTCKEIFMQSVGNDPSMKIVIKLAHPKPLDAEKNTLVRWLMGYDFDAKTAPDCVLEYESFKSKQSDKFPSAPPEMLEGLQLTLEEWCQLASRGNWHWLRMSLNKLSKHGVFSVPEMVKIVAEKLADRQSVLKSRVYPYQIMTAAYNAKDLPQPIAEALTSAMEYSLENVPELPGNGYLLIDVSSSMSSPLTGWRPVATTVVRCCDVAALMASSILRKNPRTGVKLFNTKSFDVDLNPSAPVMENAKAIADRLCGGTSCSAPLAELNSVKATADWLVMVSDNQSWLDSNGPGTQLMKEWEVFKQRNPNAKMVCVDLQPYSTSQAQTNKWVLNVGGFSDAVFDTIERFCYNTSEGNRVGWVDEIEQVEIGQ